MPSALTAVGVRPRGNLGVAAAERLHLIVGLMAQCFAEAGVRCLEERTGPSCLHDGGHATVHRQQRPCE